MLNMDHIEKAKAKKRQAGLLLAELNKRDNDKWQIDKKSNLPTKQEFPFVIRLQENYRGYITLILHSMQYNGVDAFPLENTVAKYRRKIVLVKKDRMAAFALDILKSLRNAEKSNLDNLRDTYQKVFLKNVNAVLWMEAFKKSDIGITDTRYTDANRFRESHRWGSTIKIETLDSRIIFGVFLESDPISRSDKKNLEMSIQLDLPRETGLQLISEDIEKIKSKGGFLSGLDIEGKKDIKGNIEKIGGFISFLVSCEPTGVNDLLNYVKEMNTGKHAYKAYMLKHLKRKK